MHLVVSGSSLQIDSLEIRGCENISSLGGLGSLPVLQHLEIRGCSKLAEAGSSLTRDASGDEEEDMVVSGSSLQIDSLEIDQESLLLVEPLKSLIHTRTFFIEDAEMKSLPERWLLQNRLSLRHLYIPRAGERTIDNGSPEWNKISHIAQVQIGGSYFILGKKCSKETHDRLCFSDHDELTTWANQQKDDKGLHYWKKQFCLQNAS